MGSGRDVVAALAQRTRFEEVDVQETASKVRILGRVPVDAAQQNLAHWFALTRLISEKSQVPGCVWSFELSKLYFLRAGKWVFAWRLLFQSSQIDVRTCLGDIVDVIRNASLTAAPSVGVDEVALVGVSASRNTLVRGKGATPMLGGEGR